MRSDLIASGSRALLKKVTQQVRAVTIARTGKKICLQVYCDGPIGDDLREDMSVAGAEIAADFPGFDVDETCVRLDAPERIAFGTPDGELVVLYARKEG